MVAPLRNLSPCFPEHMINPRDFFMSLKEKGLKLPQGTIMYPRDKGYKLPQRITMSPKKKKTKLC
jgi:hypothetical protein